MNLAQQAHIILVQWGHELMTLTRGFFLPKYDKRNGGSLELLQTIKPLQSLDRLLSNSGRFCVEKRWQWQGGFKRPKKCLTPSENENSKNRLKIWQIPIQT